MSTYVRHCFAPARPKGPHWRLDGAAVGEHGAYVVDLTWSRTEGSLRGLRADAFALVGEFAESTAHVRQVIADTAIEYHVATGMLHGDGPFAGHGHLVWLRVTGPDLPRLIAGSRRPAQPDAGPAD